jgi:hypothetical protein
MYLLQVLGDLLARLGHSRRTTRGEVALADPVQAWRLVADPALWPLWMPGVRDLLDRPRQPRANARYRVRCRAAGGRLGLAGGDREATIQVEEWGPGARMTWRLISGRAEEHYAVSISDGVARAVARGGESALVVVHGLERQSRP